MKEKKNKAGYPPARLCTFRQIIPGLQKQKPQIILNEPGEHISSGNTLQSETQQLRNV